MMVHLRMLLKAIEIVFKGIWIGAIIVTFLIAYLQYADASYKEQWGWEPHVENDIGLH